MIRHEVRPYRTARETVSRILPEFVQLLAIHTSNQHQFYPECAQLKLTVSMQSTSRIYEPSPSDLSRDPVRRRLQAHTSPSSLARIRRAYSSGLQTGSYADEVIFGRSDPGVTIDIYSHSTWTNYTIPGPAVWRG